jgi:hypothetical protein
VPLPRSTRRIVFAILLALALPPVKTGTDAATQSATGPTALEQLTAEQDHQRIMDLLHIPSLRRGADGDPKSPNSANYDESKAGPFTKLPDPLILKTGKPVKSPKDWWELRRPEIVEDFDREIYGRMPANTPAVTWEVTSTTREMSAAGSIILRIR